MGDQLFTSREKRLARILLLLTRFGKEGVSTSYLSYLSNKTCLPVKSPSLSNSDQHLNLHWTILRQMARRASAEPRPEQLSGISTFARETRASRPLAHVGAEVSGRITAIEIAHAQLYNVDVDRKKRIDDAIDYFGGGTSTSPGRVSANTSRPAGTPPYGHHARL